MADVYQRVLLSPAVESLLSQEHELSVQMQRLTDEQENEWQELTLVNIKILFIKLKSIQQHL